MATESIKDNMRLLERLTVLPSDVSSIPGSPQHLLLQGLQQLKADDTAGAQASLKQLAAALHVTEDSPQLDPLRALTYIKSWKAGDAGQQQLKEFLVKELNLRFDEDGTTYEGGGQPAPLFGAPQAATTSIPPGGTSGTPATGSPAAAPLPTYITPEQYTAAAFQADLDNSSNRPVSASSVIDSRDSSTLLQAVLDGTLGLKPTVQLLTEQVIAPAVLPVAVLVKVLTDWQADWLSTSRSWQSGSTRDWQDSPVVQWVKQHWDDMTGEQVAAVRPALPGPAYGSNPDIDRPYAIARIKKALAGAPGATAADAGAGGSAVFLPWQCGADIAAAAVRLERVLAECDALGPVAGWIRVHALYAQLQLQQQQKPAVDVALLNSFMNLLRRCTWSHGGPFGHGQQQQQQQQHPLHVACRACGMQPIVGPRFRSSNNFDISLCSCCVKQPAAAAAAPYDEVKVDDSIYMLPALELPPVLQGLPSNSSGVEPELKRLIQGVIMDAAVKTEGECPSAAGLQLPSSPWSAAVVAGAHLMSGKGDAAKWARQYEENGGDLNSLLNASELSFGADSRTSYSLEDDVVLQLYTKNTGTEGVLVKVYALNCWKLYTSTQDEPDLNLELAGVAPTHTITLTTPADPMVRCRHSVPLGLQGVPGVWLVEVVAGSRRLRGRISKGGLRLLQRPSVAGQVLTVMDEEWRPVKSVKVWCDGKEYTPRPAADNGTAGSSGNEVLLPFARDESNTALVVSAQLQGTAAAGAGKACVVLFKNFRRLKEQYSLGAQLFCHQEALLPGHPLQLLLLLNLQLHGTPAPLGLLQDMQLSITTHTSEGGPVTQVIQDMVIDEGTCTAQVSYTLPQHTTSLSAALTARVLLALPGTNGEPDHQQFDVQELLPGQTSLQHSIEIEGARQSSDIWDVYLTTNSTTGSTPPATAGTGHPTTYMLQVLGRCGEPLTAPKTLSVWLDHIAFSRQHQLKFKVQTGPGGVVQLGHLQGVRQIRAQIADGVDCVEKRRGGSAAGGESADGSGPGEHAGPVRSWQIARPSWWVGGLQEQYVIAEGSSLDVRITPPAGQTVTATLLQLVSPVIATRSYGSSAASDAVVIADITAAHLQLALAPLGDSSRGSGSSLLGCAGATTVRVQGLKAGLYRLLLPAVLLKPSGGGVGSTWDQSAHSSGMAVHIHVLPAAVTARNAGANSAASAGAGAIDTTAAADVSTQEQWLYAGPEFSGVDNNEQQLLLLQPSLPRQLHVKSLECSVKSGLSLQVAGPDQLLSTAQVLLVFSRFLPDSTISAAQLLPPQLPWSTSSTTSPGFGFIPSLADQVSSWGYDGGNREGLGYGACPQACGSPASCSYSQDAKLDSAVAYVLQRRQWEASGGGRRPGVLLDRPSLLVFPHSVRSAAASASVLRGGDGGVLNERTMMKKTQIFGGAAPRKEPMREYLFGAAPEASAASCAAPCGGIALARQTVAARTPVLGFLAQPAAVLTRLHLGPDGALQLSAEQLQQLLSEATGFSKEGAAAGQSVWDVTGCRVAYAAVFDPRTLGQFGAAWCAVQGQQQQQDTQGETAAEAAGVSSCLPAAAVRDIGLDRPVDPGVVSALSCDVVVLHQPGDSLSLHNPEAAEAGVFGSLQQMYHLLAGLMKAAESGGATMQPHHGRGLGILQGLPRPCVPPGTQESASVLLRQWESLMLQWPVLGAALRYDLISKLASSELMFFLAVKDKPAYEQLLLPMLKCKLPSELSCLDQVLLLQAQHNQPPIPVIQQPQEQQQAEGAGHVQASPAVDASYDVHKQGLLQHWYAPHRYEQLNCLERLLLAALEGREALLQFSTDLEYQLQSPAEKRGIKRTWMSRERRTVFEFALLLAQSLEQQQRDTQDSSSGSDRTSDADTADDEGPFGDTAGGLPDEDSDFVKVDREDAAGPMGGGMFGVIALGAPPMPASAMMAPMMAMPVPPPPPSAPGGSLFGAMAPPAPSPARAMAARHTADLSARARVALEASDESYQVRVPKETKEWAETGWWKCEGPQPQLIPVARFWADYANHLANQPPGTPFVPSDPTDVAASTAAVVAALAVADLPWEGAAMSSSAAGSSNSSKGRVKPSAVGCHRSYQGATLTLTAKAPCLLWVKMMKPLVSIGPESIPAGAAAAALPASAATGSVDADSAAPGGHEWVTVPGASSNTAGAATATAPAPAPAPGAGTPGASVANSVLVVDRLYDPGYASSTDPETGEEVLLVLQPSEQQPLLTGQRYCRSVVVTSTVAAERDLQLLVQLPQGAMALDGSVGTISRDIKLPAYTSLQVQQTFYFPQPGVYQQAPMSVVTVTGRAAWVPSAPAGPLHVVDAASAPDSINLAEPQVDQYIDPAARWRQCISRGNKQLVLEYLRTGDLTGARLSDVSKFCKDPAFFDAAVSALNSRHVYKQAIWKWAVVHLHGPALKQLLMNSQLTQKLQTQYKVPVARLLDSVFSSSGGASGSSADGAGDWVLCEEVVRHPEYWPWINPYCRPITHSGSDANLPSVLRDNPAISQQWKSFLLSLLMDCTQHPPGTSTTTTTAAAADGSGTSSSSVRRLTAQQATAAAVFLLLQDRIDDAEEVLTANGCWNLGQGVVHEAASQQAMSGPLSMQRDYLTAWLALCRPVAGPAAAGSVVGDSQESVTAEAVRVGKAVVNKYKGYVAGPWAKRFKQLAAMISQLEQQQTGASAAAAALDNADSIAAGLPVQPMLTVISLEGSTLKLHVAGLKQLQLAAYQIDTELLFTTQPFSSFSSSSSSQLGGSLGACPLREPSSHKQRGSSADGGLGRVSYVQPTAQVQVQLQYGGVDSTIDSAPFGTTTGPSSSQGSAQPHAVTVSCSPVGLGSASAADSAGTDGGSASGVYECVLDLDSLMPGMRQLSVLLEVTGGGLGRSLPRFASALTVHVLENQGMLQAYFKPTESTHAAGHGGSGLTPAAAVYVKVYARDAGGDEFFYKDGYTDLRGRFDYVTLTSTADMSRVVRYSLLVAAREQGAVMVQAAPPAK